MIHGFMLQEGKQQSGQTEMRRRAQARSLLMCPAGLSLHFYEIPLSKRLNRKILYIAVTERLPCIFAESLKEKILLPRETFDTHTKLLRNNLVE